MHLVKLESRQTSSNRDISICFDSNTCMCAILPLMFSLFCFCILETPNLRDSRVLCRPKWRETWTQSVQARLRWTWACVSQNTDHSTTVRNYHGQYQEDSLYLSALINSQPTWYKLTWQSLFHQPSRCRCLLPLQCLQTLWVSSWATFQNKRIIVNRNVVWKMKLCGLKHHDFPHKPLVTLGDRWQHQVTHDQRRRQNKHNPSKTSACVFATRLNNSGLTSQLAWQGDYCVSYWNYQV